MHQIHVHPSNGLQRTKTGMIIQLSLFMSAVWENHVVLSQVFLTHYDLANLLKILPDQKVKKTKQNTDLVKKKITNFSATIQST